MTEPHRTHPSSRRHEVYAESDRDQSTSTLMYWLLRGRWARVVMWLENNLYRLPLPGGRRKRRPGKTY